MSNKSTSYDKAGVNIDLAHSLMDNVKDTIKDTYRNEVVQEPGTFGGLFAIDFSKYKEPVLVSSVDGVGTKLMVASLMNNHKTVGHDIVNHCINDIACQGAEPLYFLDYLGIGKLKSPLYENVINGIAEACACRGVALLGGETAEMPGMYGDDYDLVGAITGVVDRSKMITGRNISEGDIIIGLSSSGLHTNGYSLARKVLFDESGMNVNSCIENSNQTLGNALLEPHVCYWQAIKRILNSNIHAHGIAHITGGGFYDNVSRILPGSVNAQIEPERLPIPPIFNLIKEKGNIDNGEMYRVFNMGVGMMWVVPSSDEKEALSICKDEGFNAEKIGEITPGSGSVKLEGIDINQPVLNLK